jgi:hypothetical protein
MAPSPDTAILTGDLIGSTRLPAPEVDRALALLAASARDIAGWAGGETRFTRFRGDGWQIRVTEPALALRAALVLLARMRAPDSPLASRVAIGIGPITSAGTRDLADGSGPAFTASGRTLDSLPKNGTLDIAGQGVGLLHSGFVNLLEAIMRRWTPEQAEAISLHLHPDDPILDEVAGRLGISIQAASLRIRGGSGPDLRLALKAWESDARLAG